jgi:methyl-accepting chemotaxis protein
MQVVLAPAKSFLGQFRNQVKIPLLGFFFLLPLVVALALERTLFAQVLVVGLFIFACYMFTAHHAWVKDSFVTLNALMRAISKGNLNADINSDKLGGQFLMAYERMVKVANSLDPIVRQTHASATNVMHSANAIAEGAVQLSQRTEEQAAALEETTSTMEELSATVKQNADNCKTANTLAGRTSATAENGGVMVRQAIETMGRIDESSKKVADIIGVVEEIAFQTNLLALNAAVEAARAGDHGHGFAVVASEVRNLSQRSAAAVKEIKALIEESVVSVEEGNKHVNATGTLIQDIVAHIRDVAQHLGEITSALNEQSAGVEEINRALVHLDRMTQQNAGLVQQTMTAADSLRGATTQVASTVEMFVSGTATPMPTPARPARKTQPVESPPARRTPATDAAARAARLRVVRHNPSADSGTNWKEF